MKILALEFSSAQRSVAVLRKETVRTNEFQPASIAREGSPIRIIHPSEIVSEVTETGVGATRALGMVEDALREARLEREEIECIVVGLGPGSYTGIRAGIALVQGWQLARDVKLLGLSSAEALAAQAQANNLLGRVNVVIDAQREEFYLAVYDVSANGYREVEPLKIVAKNEIEMRQQNGEIILGSEVTRWFPKGQLLFPSAATLAKLAAARADFVPGEQLEPIYLRETKFVKAPPLRIL